MKLQVEIVNNKFIYSYVIGTSEHNSSSELCADAMILFAKLVELCHSSSNFHRDEKVRVMQEKALEMFDVHKQSNSK